MRSESAPPPQLAWTISEPLVIALDHLFLFADHSKFTICERYLLLEVTFFWRVSRCHVLLSWTT